ncbi:hypothetical protein [Paenibacillus sp. 481]|uniref:hypothetical protein n=1 Tax=Paenibacillus sp. 481 TaxID=2835869 RepID=UPI001E500420|nr:hypothetical protein [Paenibacillus sp. 481]UHA72215.1 hypothetical protein KIK04_16130 [Paenibacillus sp. 481]
MSQHRINKKWYVLLIAVFIVSACSAKEEATSESTPVATTESTSTTTATPEAKPEPTPEPPAEPEKQKQPEIKPYESLSDLDTFIIEFNKTSNEYGFSINKDNVEVSRGEEVLSFRYVFNDKVGIMGTIHKNDLTLRDVGVIGKPAETENEVIERLNITRSLITATNPQLSADEIDQVLLDAGLSKEISKDNSLTGSTVRNGVQYDLSFSEKNGFLLFARIAKN